MKIIILGAGQVGGSLAAELASEANDITVVDVDATRLRVLGDRLDIRTIQGRGSLPTGLRQGGADDGDMLIAVPSSRWGEHTSELQSRPHLVFSRMVEK